MKNPWFRQASVSHHQQIEGQGGQSQEAPDVENGDFNDGEPIDDSFMVTRTMLFHD